MKKQNDQILDLLKQGPLTALQALHQAGCLRLAARIHDLRGMGHKIKADRKTLPNGKVVAQYELET